MKKGLLKATLSLTLLGTVLSLSPSTTWHHVEAAKMDAKTFNTKSSALTKQINSVKATIKTDSLKLKNSRLANSKLIADFFGQDIVGYSETELLAYYEEVVLPFLETTDDIDDSLDSDENDDSEILFGYLSDIAMTNASIKKLNSKISQYEKSYNTAVKATKYDEAIKIRTNQWKAYVTLSKAIKEATTLENSFHVDALPLFEKVWRDDDSSDDDISDDDSSDDSSNDDSKR